MMCSGTIIQVGPRVVIAGAGNYRGIPDHLRAHGVAVIIADDGACMEGD